MWKSGYVASLAVTITVVTFVFQLRMWMNVLEATIPVMIMQLAITRQEIIPALATLDTQAMGLYATVS